MKESKESHGGKLKKGGRALTHLSYSESQEAAVMTIHLHGEHWGCHRCAPDEGRREARRLVSVHVNT